MDKCHFCNQDILLFGKKAPCPNCRETVEFHRDCHRDLHFMQPHCHGRYVGHTSGHTVDLHDNTRCAHCKLAREFWNKWHCAPGVVELNRKQLEQRRQKMVMDQPVLGRIQ